MHRCEYGMCYIWKRERDRGEREREKLDSLSINYVDW